MRNDDVIRSAIPLTHASGAPVELVVYYDPYDPLAVTAEFRYGPLKITRKFARDLLADGMIKPAGLGNVRIRPGPDKCGLVTFELMPSPGSGTLFSLALEASSAALGDFLGNTYDAVPPDAESRWIDIDEELARLFPE